MTDDLAERMRRARVEDLLLMARARPEDGVLPEAVVAAQTELARRDLPEEEVEELTRDLEAWQAEDASASTRHLSTPARIFFGVFFFTLIGVGAFRVLRMRGYNQMATDALVSTAIGWGVSIALFVIGDFFFRGS